MKRNLANRLVEEELGRTMRKFPPFASYHEGYAVVLEELDELWAEVKRNPKERTQNEDHLRTEAIQVAAMAMRFLIDLVADPPHQSAQPCGCDPGISYVCEQHHDRGL